MTASDRTPTRPPLEFEIELDAPPSAVWKALTEAEGLASWFPLEARVEPGEGGTIWLSWGGGTEWTTHIAGWEPERRLLLHEIPPQEALELLPESKRKEALSAAMAIEFTIETRGGRTVLRLVHSGWSASADWDDMYEGTRDGWTTMLRHLVFHLDRHDGAPRSMAFLRPRVSGSPAEAWSRVLGPDGFALEPPDAGAGRAVRLRLGEGMHRARVEVWNPPHTLVASLPELEESVLTLEAESRQGGEGWRYGIWLSSWGVPEERAAELQAALEATVGALFPEAAAAPGESA